MPRTEENRQFQRSRCKVYKESAWWCIYTEDPWRYTTVSSLLSALMVLHGVDMGRPNGSWAKMKPVRTWLVTIHCLNQRLELVIGDSLQWNSSLKRSDEMINIHHLSRNSIKKRAHEIRLAQRLSYTWVSFVNSKENKVWARHYHSMRLMIC